LVSVAGARVPVPRSWQCQLPTLKMMMMVMVMIRNIVYLLQIGFPGAAPATASAFSSLNLYRFPDCYGGGTADSGGHGGGTSYLPSPASLVCQPLQPSSSPYTPPSPTHPASRHSGLGVKVFCAQNTDVFSGTRRSSSQAVHIVELVWI